MGSILHIPRPKVCLCENTAAADYRMTCTHTATDTLETCACVQLPVVDEEGGLAPPEFGFATSNPSATPGAARGSALTWEAMRQVGAGFWLTDQQVRLLQTHIATQPQKQQDSPNTPQTKLKTHPKVAQIGVIVRSYRSVCLNPWSWSNTATMSISVQPVNE